MPRGRSSHAAAADKQNDDAGDEHVPTRPARDATRPDFPARVVDVPCGNLSQPQSTHRGRAASGRPGSSPGTSPPAVRAPSGWPGCRVASGGGSRSRMSAISPRLRIGGKGAGAGEHFVEHRTEGEQVRARIARPAPSPAPATCRGVCRATMPSRVSEASLDARADGSPAATVRRRRARPKSSSFTPAFVSMMLAGFRSRCTTPRACAAASASAISMPNVQRLLNRQRPARQPRGQRLALEQFHHQERHVDAVDRRRADVVQRADVRMVQAGDAARLALEPLARVGIGGGLASRGPSGRRCDRAACRGPCRPRPSRRRQGARESRTHPAGCLQPGASSVRGVRSSSRACRAPVSPESVGASRCAASSDSTSRRIASSPSLCSRRKRRPLVRRSLQRALKQRANPRPVRRRDHRGLPRSSR